MIFTCGLPGSGKTSQLKNLYDLEDIKILDLDREMKRHRRFDPADPTALYDNAEAYAWADARVEAQFQDCLRSREPPLVAVDGTGARVERTSRRMRQAQEAGYWVQLLYVKVSLETAMRRNLLRKRQVPYETLCAYHKRLEEAFLVEKEIADEVIEVSNEEDDGMSGRMRWGRLYELYYSLFSLPPEDSTPPAGREPPGG